VEILPADLEHRGESYEFEKLMPMLGMCKQITVNFDGATSAMKKRAAQLCFQQVVHTCEAASHLRVKNWCMFQRSGLPSLASGLPSLLHLELQGCDLLTDYDDLIPVFRRHPQLQSLRAAFQTKAVASRAFAEALPVGLQALGFVRMDNADVLALVLARCQDLQHLWLQANGHLPPSLATTLVGAGQKLRTLALPALTSEDTCARIVQAAPELELMCRMRVSTPAFGTAALAAVGFEPFAPGQGLVVRRCGSHASLTSHGCLWAPHGDAEDPSESMVRPASVVEQKKACPPRWQKPAPAAVPAVADKRRLKCEASALAREAAFVAAARRAQFVAVQ